MLRDDDTATQNHFKIGEVADLVGVRPHVLRYWEQEFPGLRPKKTRGAHRHYSRANVALAKAIHALVVEQGYSIAGARKRLDGAEHVGAGQGDSSSRDGTDLGSLREDLLAVRDDLRALLALVDGVGVGEHEASPATPRASSSDRSAASDPVSVVVARDSTRRR